MEFGWWSRSWSIGELSKERLGGKCEVAAADLDFLTRTLLRIFLLEALESPGCCDATERDKSRASRSCAEVDVGKEEERGVGVRNCI